MEVAATTRRRTDADLIRMGKKLRAALAEEPWKIDGLPTMDVIAEDAAIAAISAPGERLMRRIFRSRPATAEGWRVKEFAEERW